MSSINVATASGNESVSTPRCECSATTDGIASRFAGVATTRVDMNGDGDAVRSFD